MTKPEFDKMKQDMIDMKRRLSRVYVAQRPPTWTSIEIYKDQPQPAAGQDGARTFQIHSEDLASDDFERLNHQAGFQLGLGKLVPGGTHESVGHGPSLPRFDRLPKASAGRALHQVRG